MLISLPQAWKAPVLVLVSTNITLGSLASCMANWANKLTVATVINVQKEYSQQQLAVTLVPLPLLRIAPLKEQYVVTRVSSGRCFRVQRNCKYKSQVSVAICQMLCDIMC